MADFIKVSSREEATKLAYQHYQGKGNLAGANRYILPDGTKLRIRKRISSVSAASDLKAENFETKQKADVKRQAAGASQTVGKNVYGKGVVIPKNSGLEEHHKRILNVYAPFFEGLNRKETKELAQWFVDEGFPLGDVEENLEATKKLEHSAIHEWTKNNFIEPKTGKPLLNFKNYTLNERLVPALTFLEQVQPAVDEKLAEIKKGVQQKPSSRLMPKTGQPIDPELVSQFSRQIGNRINRRLGKSPFDETLDTTSQKYLENIGKYQQFIDLDEASKAALGLYGENVKQYYADLNRQLRSGSTANLTPQQIAINEFLQENLTKAIDVLPSEQRNLYRAIKDPAREGLTNLKVGDVYTDKGFGSFSADEKAALRFIRKDAPSALITVQNAAGTNIGPVMEFDESEFLQKPGAQYRLESIDEVFSPKTGGTVPNYKFTQVTNQSLGQKAAAIANREPVKPPKPVVVTPKPVTPKPKPKPKTKTVTKPTPVVATKTTKVKPTSASMQIRAMQNTTPDVIRIQPGMSLPSSSLIQGI